MIYWRMRSLIIRCRVNCSVVGCAWWGSRMQRPVVPLMAYSRQRSCFSRSTKRRRRRRRWRRRCWRRRRRRCGRRLTRALAVDHVLDVHEAALVRIFVDRRGCRRHEGVRAVGARWQLNTTSALEEAAAVHRRTVRRAALAVHEEVAVGRRADDVLVRCVVVGVLDRHREVAPADSRWRRW